MQGIAVIEVEKYRFIKDLLSKNKCKSSYPESFKKENTTISKEDEIAKEFNNFFSNIKTTLEIIPKSLFLTRIKTSELDKIIRELCPQKSAGYDGIHPKVIKDMGTCISSVCVIFSI
jgi:hypothetical protein